MASDLRDDQVVAGRDFLGKLVEDAVITKGERARFADAATGVATEEGRQLIERMFYATALGDPDVISRAPPAVLRKLDTSLPGRRTVRAAASFPQR